MRYSETIIIIETTDRINKDGQTIVRTGFKDGRNNCKKAGNNKQTIKIHKSESNSQRYSNNKKTRKDKQVNVTSHRKLSIRNRTKKWSPEG